MDGATRCMSILEPCTLTIATSTMRAAVPTTIEELRELADEHGRDAWMALLSRAQHEGRAIEYEHDNG